MRSSSLTRHRARAPCIGNLQLYPQDQQGSPPNLGLFQVFYECEGNNRSSSVSLEQRKLKTERIPTHQSSMKEGLKHQSLLELGGLGVCEIGRALCRERV